MSTINGATKVAESLGLEWRYGGQDEMVVTFVGGPDQGDLDVLSPSEIERFSDGNVRFLLSWTGCEIPLRVYFSPGIGMVFELEHLRYSEFLNFHKSMMSTVIPSMLHSHENADKLLIGYDTRGVVEFAMHAFVRGEPAPYREALGGPDFLVIGRELWDPAFFALEEDHRLDESSDPVIITSR